MNGEVVRLYLFPEASKISSTHFLLRRSLYALNLTVIAMYPGAYLQLTVIVISISSSTSIAYPGEPDTL